MRNLTYSLSWSWLHLQFIYSHIANEICSMTQTYQQDPLKSLVRPENINSYNSFQAGLTLNPAFGLWHPTLEAMLYKQWLSMETHVGNKLGNPVAVFQLSNTFDLKWLTASVVTTAQTEGNMGNKHICQGYFNTDLSFYKSLLNNRLTLTLDASDLFGTGNQHRTFYSGAQRTTFLRHLLDQQCHAKHPLPPQCHQQQVQGNRCRTVTKRKNVKNTPKAAPSNLSYSWTGAAALSG